MTALVAYAWQTAGPTREERRTRTNCWSFDDVPQRGETGLGCEYNIIDYAMRAGRSNNGLDLLGLEPGLPGYMLPILATYPPKIHPTASKTITF